MNSNIDSNEPKPKGCVFASIIFALIFVSAISLIIVWASTTSTGSVFVDVVKGKKELDDLSTIIVLEIVMRNKGVPANEYHELERRIDGRLKPAIENMDEGEAETFANMIRDAANDGELTESEIGNIEAHLDKYIDTE